MECINQSIIISNMPKLFLLPFSAGKRGRYSYKKRSEYALISGEMMNATFQGVPSQPRPIEDEVVVLATRLSEVFLSNSTYPENYFENITSVQRAEMVGKLNSPNALYFLC